MEEATGAPSSLAVSDPKRLRASGRDGETVMTEPPSPLRMLLSRHTRPPQLAASLRGCALVLGGWPRKQRAFGCLSFRELLAISDHRLTNVRAPCASVRIFLSNQNVLASERSAARLAHQSGGLGVPGSNPGAPTN